MADSNVFNLNKPEKNDSRQEVQREGARKMLAAAYRIGSDQFLLINAMV